MIFLLPIPVIMLPAISTPATGFDREIPNRETILFPSFKPGFPEVLSVGFKSLSMQQFLCVFHLESSFQSVYYVGATDCPILGIEKAPKLFLLRKRSKSDFGARRNGVMLQR